MSENLHPDGAREVLRNYRDRLSLALKAFDFDQLLPLRLELEALRMRGGTVFVAGNGGSASTSNHYAIDWGIGTGLTNPTLKVMSLSESVSSVTATGNDQNFDRVFARQLLNFGRSDDLLVVISASGNSPNLLELAQTARDMGVKVCAVTGFDGGRLREMCDLSIHVETELGDYGVAEDLHLMVGHVMKELIRG